MFEKQAGVLPEEAAQSVHVSTVRVKFLGVSETMLHKSGISKIRVTEMETDSKPKTTGVFVQLENGVLQPMGTLNESLRRDV